jgi:hypothetical protein
MNEIEHEHRCGLIFVPELSKALQVDSQIKAQGSDEKVVGFILRLFRAIIDAQSIRPAGPTITMRRIVQGYIH